MARILYDLEENYLGTYIAAMAVVICIDDT